MLPFRARCARLALLLALGATVAVPCPANPPHNDSIPTLVRLSRVEFTGLARYTRDRVLEVSELRLGQTLTDTEVREISSRLLKTGLFKRVGNRYLITGTSLDITFEVEEAQFDVPVLFDNFVWFTDAELSAAVSGKLPGFEGKASETGPAIDRIGEALQALLVARELPGKVTHRPSFDDREGGLKHIFKVDGVNVPICAFLFPGAASDRESELKDRSRVLVGEPYSRYQVIRFAKLTLLPPYLSRGYLRAGFGEPQVRLEPAPGCEGGVAVTLRIQEGDVHTWDGAKWIGNALLSAAELDALLGMKKGEVADALKINDGLDSVKRAWGAKGFLDLTLEPVLRVGAAAATVVYEIRIEDGPQYRMGSLLIEGLSERASDQVRRKWRLAGGAPYDATYLGEFVRKVMIDPRVISSGATIHTAVNPDRRHQTVDVSIRVGP